MRIPRIYTSQELQEGALLRLSSEPAHHLHRVLRLQPGADILAFNGDGREFHATISAADQSGLWLQVYAGSEPAAPPKLSLSLLQGIAKGERMDLALQKAVEIAACEQSGRTRIPELSVALSFAHLCEAPPRHLKLVLHPGGAQTLNQLSPERQVALLTGPEGGLSEGELARAEAAGFLPVRLGPRVLRTETAPLAAISALQALWGDFRD